MSAEKFDLAELERLHAAASAGDWTAYRMVHHEHGGDLTPEEAGEYVENSVVKSAGESGSTAFLAIRVQKAEAIADVCHVGNGPTSPANAASISALHNAAPALFAAARESENLRAERDALVEGMRQRDFAHTTQDRVSAILDQELAKLLDERDALRAQLAMRDRVFRAWLLDRAEQYDNASAMRSVFDDLLKDIDEGDHHAAWVHGDLDDLLGKQDVEAIEPQRSELHRLRVEFHAARNVIAAAEDVIAAAREANSVIADEWNCPGHENLTAALAAYDGAKGGAK